MSNPIEEPERRAPFPGPNARKAQAPYKFTPEELRVLKECNSESFFQRCLPFSTIFGAATYYAVKTGYINGNRRFGALPKVTAAVVVGFFLGKFSYQRKCAEKFMALPDSKLGHLLRARKQGFLDDRDPSAVPNITLSPFGGMGMTDSYSDIPPSPPSGSYDYGSTPLSEGLDDSFRPSVDNPIILHEQEMPPEQKHVTTYDELRKKNREEYEQKRLAIYRQTRLPKTASPQPPPSNEDVELSDEYKPSTGSKTKYGDVWA